MKKNIPLVFLFLCISFSVFSQTKIDSLQIRLKEVSSDQIRLAILDTLSDAMIRANHPDQYTYLDRVITLAKKMDDYDMAASKTRFIAQKYITNNQPDSTIYVVEELLEEKSRFTTKKSEAHLLLKRGAAYFNLEQLEKAVTDYNTSATFFMKSGDSIFAADAYYFAGQVYTNQRDFTKAVQSFEKAYELYDVLGDAQYANYTINELAGLYARNGFRDKSIAEREKVLTHAKSIKNAFAISYAYAQLASDYCYKKEYEICKKYADSLVTSLKALPDDVDKSELMIQPHKLYIDYYLHKEDLEKAKFHLEEAEKYRLSSSAPEYNETSLLLGSADYYLKTKEYAKAQSQLEKLLAKKENVGDVNLNTKAEKKIAEVFAIQRDYKNAYTHLSQYVEAKEKRNSEIKTNTFLYYQSLFETERKDTEIFKKKTEIEILEKDKQIEEGKQRVLWVALLAIIIIAGAISYYIWQSGKRKRKMLFDKIAQSKKELKEFTAQLLNKSKVQEALTKELEELKNELGEKQNAQKLQDLSTIRILTPDDWYTFKHKFTMVYPAFFSDLKKKSYDLTKSEERLLAMEKLDLSTNEIANMLAISQDSVTRSRSRLRKKINAPKGASILEYLEAS
ncbi:tetratricopeptide repeat protein [uncultured Aquimarina sp.]|uniref:tetratricopeptide repeat protein n=1 Tax=uncultured Aquimarina sp. TaxID=575652 RepID=UPI0026239D29|nr:tetratricopeptide repeat protein [uncultured Aquimarina sp.]